MSDLVGNPEDWSSCVVAHMLSTQLRLMILWVSRRIIRHLLVLVLLFLFPNGRGTIKVVNLGLLNSVNI